MGRCSQEVGIVGVDITKSISLGGHQVYGVRCPHEDAIRKRPEGIDYRRYDEIGKLITSFNLMSEALKTAHDSLTRRAHYIKTIVDK